MEITEMKHLIKSLRKGLEPKVYRLVRQRPVDGFKIMADRSALMQEGGDRLAEAYVLVVRLMSPDVTFGDRETAERWLESNKDL